MTAMSDYLENELLDHALGTGAWTAPTNIYVKLHIDPPGQAGLLNAAANATRIVTGAMSAAATGLSDNDAAITWTNVSTTETYSHISIWDAATDGNCLFVGALTAPVAVTLGDDFEIAAGALDITFE